jgi:hypothetical protein
MALVQGEALLVTGVSHLEGAVFEMVFIWNTATSDLTCSIQGSDVAVSRTSSIVAVADGNGLSTWDPSACTRIASYEAKGSPVSFHDELPLLALFNAGSLSILDLRDGTLGPTFVLPGLPPYPPFISPDWMHLVISTPGFAPSTILLNPVR